MIPRYLFWNGFVPFFPPEPYENGKENGEYDNHDEHHNPNAPHHQIILLPGHFAGRIKRRQIWLAAARKRGHKQSDNKKQTPLLQPLFHRSTNPLFPVSFCQNKDAIYWISFARKNSL